MLGEPAVERLPGVDSTKTFGQPTRLEAGAFGNEATPLLYPLGHGVGLADLRLVAEECLDLRLDVVGDVDEVVEVGAGHHPHFGDGVRFETLFGQEMREGELVARIGVDRRQGGLSGSKVVGMAGIDPVEVPHRRLAQDQIRLHLTDHSTDRLAQFEVGNHPSVGVAEEVELVYPDDLGCRGLLLAAYLRHARSADGVVESTGIAIGDEQVDHLVARGHEAGGGAGGTEVEVIWVGSDGEHASSHFPKLTICGHDGLMANMSKSEREDFLAQPHVGVISIEAEGRGPVTVPIWYSYEPGGHVKVLTGVDSKKTKLLQAAGRFSLCVQRERLPYKYVSVEGPIVETRPAELELDSRPMAHRYLGPGMGDQYVEDGAEGDDSLCFLMAPQRWSSVDYGSNQ